MTPTHLIACILAVANIAAIAVFLTVSFVAEKHNSSPTVEKLRSESSYMVAIIGMLMCILVLGSALNKYLLQ